MVADGYKILEVTNGPVVTTAYSTDGRPDVQSYVLLLDIESYEGSRLINELEIRCLFIGTEPFKAGQYLADYSRSGDDSKTIDCKITSVEERAKVPNETPYPSWNIETDAFGVSLTIFDTTSKFTNPKDAKNAPFVGQSITVWLTIDRSSIDVEVEEFAQDSELYYYERPSHTRTYGRDATRKRVKLNLDSKCGEGSYDRLVRLIETFSTTKEIGKELGLSRQYTSTIIKEILGESYSEYLKNHNVNRRGVSR